MTNDLINKSRLFVAVLGTVVVIYCVIVLGYVGTTPDLGLRGLLSDRGDMSAPQGMLIRAVVELDAEGVAPRSGDVLVNVRDKPIRSFQDFAYSLQALRNAPIDSGGRLANRSDMADDSAGLLPALVETDDGSRFVRVEFQRAGKRDVVRTRLQVKSLPLGEVLLSFVWLTLQFLIFAVGALAAWHRPFDRVALRFFTMCAVTMVAFIGGFHWWVLAGSLVLTAPFLVSAVFVPAVSLHFFLCYPRQLELLTKYPRNTLAVIYSVPLVAMVVMLSLSIFSRVLTSPFMSETAIEWVQGSLMLLRGAIYSYLVFAAGCFFVMLVALANDYFSATTAIEQNQVKWMFRAGLFSAIPITYTLYLALFDRTEFALGSARLPMFLASLSFMLAYSIGISRFKLMLVDEFVSKGMLYQAATQGLTIGFGIFVALVAYLAINLNVAGAVPGRFQQVLSVGVLLTFSVVVLSWSRDRVQQMIDRRFYREKYQLDKALQRVNRSLDRLADRNSLGQRMLASCKEVLTARFAALYLRDGGRGSFQLLVVDGTSGLPERLDVPDELLAELSNDSAFSAISSPSVGDEPELIRSLRRFRIEMLHALESDDETEGLIALGRKLNGSGYTAEDLTFLNTLGQFTTVALRSVKLHQDFSRLNDELQLKASKIDEQKRQIAIMQAELTQQGEPRPVEEATELRREMIKGNSRAIRDVLETVRKVAATESTVLIQGASGTGKELLAQAIHDNSPRRAGPMVRVHCAALSPSLLESELFGHVKGAFTGAHQNRVGRFEMANGGTLFLDEIGDISLETQIKLLRVLQTRSFEPVGGTRTVTVDVRLITATHQNLPKLIASRRFREDLYYRLNVVNVTLPSLHERADDIFELALHFLKRASVAANKSITSIDPDAMEVLQRYSWPGNIRELENVIERAVVMCDGPRITVKELSIDLSGAPVSSMGTMPGLMTDASLEKVLRVPSSVLAEVRKTATSRQQSDAEEVASLRRALEECKGNKADAARLLGLPRSTFYSKLKKAGIQ